MRVSYKTDLETVITLLTSKHYWHLKKPELIISVTGGANLNLHPLLKDTFCKGLVKVATTTSIHQIIRLYFYINLKYKLN